MSHDTWAYVASYAGLVEYSIFDVQGKCVAQACVSHAQFNAKSPQSIARVLDVDFVILDGVHMGPPVTCPAQLASPIEIGKSHANLARFIDPSAPTQSFAQTAALGAFVADHPKWDGIVILAGPVSTWAHISAGELISFRTSIGLQVALNVLHTRSLEVSPDLNNAFSDAVSNGLSQPETVFSKLSEDTSPDVYLGLALGAEMAAFRTYWLGQEIVVLGNHVEASLIEAALKSQFAMVRMDATDYFTRGVRAIREHILGIALS